MVSVCFDAPSSRSQMVGVHQGQNHLGAARGALAACLKSYPRSASSIRRNSDSTCFNLLWTPLFGSMKLESNSDGKRLKVKGNHFRKMQQPSSGLVATSSHGDDSSPWSNLKHHFSFEPSNFRLDQIGSSMNRLPSSIWYENQSHIDDTESLLDQYQQQSDWIQRISSCCHLCNPHLSLYWFPLVPPSQKKVPLDRAPPTPFAERERNVWTPARQGPMAKQNCRSVLFVTRMKQPLQMLAVNRCITLW